MPTFDHIFIDERAKTSAVAQRFKTLFSNWTITTSQPFDEGTLSPQEFDRSKRNLFITPFEGQFFKRCPGSRPGLQCCNYFVLNLGLQCDMNCSYCYLQSFINSPVLKVYSNIEKAFSELDQFSNLNGLRIGTGEVIDSLSLDPLTLYSNLLIEYFRSRPQWTLEFKTKSAHVDQFLDCPHAQNVLVSWSINPQFIISSEEHLTASLDERFEAAKKCIANKFKVAFHLDPLIWHPEWKQNYGELVDRICAEFSPEDLTTLSVGALRFQPEQKAMMRERFGMKSYVTQAEMFKSKDGKLRYAQEIRNEMFEFVVSRFRQHEKKWRIFLCMETPESWLKAFDSQPQKLENLNSLYDSTNLRNYKKLRLESEQ